MDTITSSPVRLFEELSVNAWPALQTCCYDGWLLRFANGYTRRANSVHPLYESSIDLNDKIRHCERLYERFGQNTVFKLTSAQTHRDLDQALDAHGYLEDAHSKVLVLDDLNPQPAPEYRDAELLSTATAAWIDNLVMLNSADPAHVPVMKAILNGVPLSKAFATLRDGETLVAMGMAVIEREYVCFNNIVVNKNWRGRGIGTQLMRHLIAWAKANGARQGYLQVMRDNEKAIKLYTRLGFHEVYDYWYRVQPTPQSTF